MRESSTTRIQRTRAFFGVLAILGMVAAGRGYASDIRVSNRLPSTSNYIQPERTTLSNGLSVTLFTADNLKTRVFNLDGVPVIQLDAVRYVTIVDDINDASIYNRGDGSFHPFDRALVMRTLETMTHPSLDMDVTVYMLPFPRRNTMVSSTSQREIFLSPHVLDIAPSIGAYIVAHEMGHVFHNVRMPDGSRSWGEYAAIRGIADESRFNEDASHSYRPKEIFAEDFRVLFGNDDAAYGGRIENTSIQPPMEIAGLRNFMGSLGNNASYSVAATKFRASSYPNPFNPSTNISVALDEEVKPGTRVSVRIYDVTGRLVRDLFEGVSSGEQLALRWDGTDNGGLFVSSSNYYAMIQAGESRSTLKLMLVK